MADNIIKSRILQSARTIAVTATAIPATALVGRSSIVIQNTGSATIYLGSSTVTVANGYPLAAGAAFSIDLGEKVVMYGIVASGTETVKIIEGL